jgi:hypothetical protein
MRPATLVGWGFGLVLAQLLVLTASGCTEGLLGAGGGRKANGSQDHAGDGSPDGGGSGTGAVGNGGDEGAICRSGSERRALREQHERAVAPNRSWREETLPRDYRTIVAKTTSPRMIR